jgi:hypothetical protein
MAETSRHVPILRRLLRTSLDGMTVLELMGNVPDRRKSKTIRKCLDRMPDAYIDRWVKGKRGQYVAVWCVTVPPPHCPHPRDRFKIKTTWVQLATAV